MNFDLNSIFAEPDFWLLVARKAITIAIIVLIFGFIIKLGARAKRVLVKKNFLPELIAQRLYWVLKWMLSIIFILLVLQQFGLSITNLWAVLTTVIAMIAIGFVAVWSVLSNILCTIMLLIIRPFRIGDHVEIIEPAMTVGNSGLVENINLVFTTLKSEDGDDVFYTEIPNNLFFQKIIRRKAGKNTITLDKQIFEEKSLLKS
jgi:small-conductance mechanosensitive channel